MLSIMLAFAVDAVTAPKLELLCTTYPRGQVVRYIFTIDPSAKTYTAMVNDTKADGGVADVTEDRITLVKASEKTTFTYRISRTTGDLQMDAGLTGQDVALVSIKGNCQKYTGKAF